MNKWSIILFLSFIPMLSNAQSRALPCDDLLTSSSCDSGWMSIGFGFDDEFDIGVTASANFGDKLFWQLGFQGSYDFCTDSCSKRKSIYVLNYGRGFSIVNRIGRISLSAGPGLVWGWVEDTNFSNFISTGIVGNAQLIATPFKETGLGLDAFFNLNPRVSTYGLRFTFVFEGNK